MMQPKNSKQNKGLFITFEGGEGAGKTTLINSIEKELIKRGIPVLRTREPGGSKLSERIRQWLLNHDTGVQVGDRAELLLFLAARAQHIEELIQPALHQGKIVLCDRFNDSTIVYQGLARGLGLDLTKQLCDLVCGEIRPDVTFFLDIDPKIGLKRTRGANKENAPNGQMDRIESEKLEFHQRVRAGFQQIAQGDPQRVHVIDAKRSENEVYRQALKWIDERLNGK